MQVAGLVVNTGVKAKLLNHCAALVRATGDTDGAASFGLGDLPNYRTDCAAGGRHYDGFARFRVDDHVHTDPGGDTWHADHTQVGRQRNAAGVDLAHGLARGLAVLLPAQ